MAVAANMPATTTACAHRDRTLMFIAPVRLERAGRSKDDEIAGVEAMLQAACGNGGLHHFARRQICDGAMQDDSCCLLAQDWIVVPHCPAMLARDTLEKRRQRHAVHLDTRRQARCPVPVGSMRGNRAA